MCRLVGVTAKHKLNTVDNKYRIRSFLWDNKLTVNRGQGADNTVRDQTVGSSLSSGEPSNISVCKAHLAHRLVGH